MCDVSSGPLASLKLRYRRATGLDKVLLPGCVIGKQIDLVSICLIGEPPEPGKHLEMHYRVFDWSKLTD